MQAHALLAFITVPNLQSMADTCVCAPNFQSYSYTFGIAPPMDSLYIAAGSQVQVLPT